MVVQWFADNRGSIPEVVSDAGVYFEATSPDELRVTLERVVTDRSVQDDLRVRGFARLQASPGTRAPRPPQRSINACDD